MKLTINEEIKKELKKYKIPLEDGLSVLILIYYDLKPSFLPDSLWKKVMITGIVNRDFKSKTYIWKIPLFEEQIQEYDWIKDWMNLFRDVNRARRGVRSAVIKRMKEFFRDNPNFTPEDVIEGTKLYLRDLNNPTYCKKSHKFIKEQDGTSMLKEWVEQYREYKKRDDRRII